MTLSAIISLKSRCDVEQYHLFYNFCGNLICRHIMFIGLRLLHFLYLYYFILFILFYSFVTRFVYVVILHYVREKIKLSGFFCSIAHDFRPYFYRICSDWVILIVNFHSTSDSTAHFGDSNFLNVMAILSIDMYHFLEF